MTEQPISIFILKSQVGALSQAESFLKNRQWIIGSGTDLREALAYIIQKQPQYVLITADHRNKKVRALPKMLMQAFPVKVIGFAEKSSGNSIKSLQSMNLEYNLQAPVSGPAIVRMLAKIKKDEETAAQNAGNANKSKVAGDSLNSSGDDKITLKDSGSQNSNSYEQARIALTKMVSSDDSSEDSEIRLGESSPFGADSDLMLQKGKASHGKVYEGEDDPMSLGGSVRGTVTDENSASSQGSSANQAEGLGAGSKLEALQENPNSSGAQGYFPNQEPTGAADSPNFDSNSGADSAGNFFDSSPSKDSENFHDGSSNWEKPKARSDDEDQEPGSKSPSFDQSPTDQKAGSGASQASNAGTELSAKSSEASDTEGEAQQKNRSGLQAPIMESEYQARQKKKDYSFSSESKAERQKEESIFVQGVQQALQESVEITSRQIEPNPIEEVSNLACITVQSARFQGYLICALGKNHSVDKSLIDLIQKRLFKFLKENGEDVKAEETLELKIEQIEFNDWALEQAEFLKKSMHQGDEVAMAFFPTTDLEVRLEDSISKDMLRISIDQLKEDTALGFDIYIYMPANQKYLLYTPKGKSLHSRQKSRLKEKGITHMHLRRDASTEVKKFKAQNYLNEKIGDYRKSKTSKSS